MNLVSLGSRSPKDSALAYAALGWHVLPCREKKPLTANGFYDASIDPKQVAAWWDQWPDAEIGWHPGPSGHVVVDLDVPKNGGGDGQAQYASLQGADPLGTDLIATTPSGGRHLVYRSPEDRRYGSVNLKRMGIDVRGQGGYVVLPDGRPGREWLHESPGEAAATEAPTWLVAWLDTTVGPCRAPGEPKAYGTPAPAGTATDERLAEVRSALYAIEPTLGREQWLACIFGVHDALDGDARGADLVERWSSDAPPYDDRSGVGQYREGEAFRIYGQAATAADRDARAVGRAGVTAASLFRLATDRGWRWKSAESLLQTTFLGSAGAPVDGPHESAAPRPSAKPSWQPPEPVKLSDWTDVADLPMARWQVRGLLPERSMAVLAGDTMMGKTFVAIDMAMRLVHGKPCFERKVQPCSVVYLCGEGQYGLSARLRAWRKEHNVTKAESEGRYCLISNRIPELSPETVGQLRHLMEDVKQAKGHSPGLVVVDTLSQALEGDENKAEVTAPVFRALAHLRDEYGCSILVIHHTQKRDSELLYARDGTSKWFPIHLNNVRGSGAITRNVDTVLGIQTSMQTSQVFELVTLKQKDSRLSQAIQFERLTVDTDRVDEEYQPESSCILVPASPRTIGALVEKDPDQKLRERENEGIARLVAALKREVRFSSRDALVSSAGGNLQAGRRFLDLAMSRKVIVDVGSNKRPVFVLPAEVDRVRAELEAERQARRNQGGGSTPVPPEGRQTDSPSAPIVSKPSETSRTDGTDETDGTDGAVAGREFDVLQAAVGEKWPGAKAAKQSTNGLDKPAGPRDPSAKDSDTTGLPEHPGGRRKRRQRKSPPPDDPGARVR